MSVDERLRDLFASGQPEVPVGPALVRVHRRAARERARRRLLVGAVVAAAAVAVLLLAPWAGTPQPPPEPAPPGPSTPVTTATPLDGTWRAGPVRASEVRALLRRERLGASYDSVRAALPEPPWTYLLNVADGALTLRVIGADGGMRTFDEEQVSTTGEELLLQPWAVPGVNRYTWSRSGGRLVLTLVATTEEGAAGGTGEAFQRAFYTVAPWRPVR